MNQGVKRLAILLGVVGAIVGFILWGKIKCWFVTTEYHSYLSWVRLGFQSASNPVDIFGYILDIKHFGIANFFLFTTVGFLIPFGFVYWVYWVVKGFKQPVTKRRKEKEPVMDSKK
jgi:hypothetical protein